MDLDKKQEEKKEEHPSGGTSAGKGKGKGREKETEDTTMGVTLYNESIVDKRSRGIGRFGGINTRFMVYNCRIQGRDRHEETQAKEKEAANATVGDTLPNESIVDERSKEIYRLEERNIILDSWYIFATCDPCAITNISQYSPPLPITARIEMPSGALSLYRKPYTCHIGRLLSFLSASCLLQFCQEFSHGCATTSSLQWGTLHLIIINRGG